MCGLSSLCIFFLFILQILTERLQRGRYHGRCWQRSRGTFVKCFIKVSASTVHTLQSLLRIFLQSAFHQNQLNHILENHTVVTYSNVCVYISRYNFWMWIYMHNDCVYIYMHTYIPENYALIHHLAQCSCVYIHEQSLCVHIHAQCLCVHTHTHIPENHALIIYNVVYTYTHMHISTILILF